MTAKKTTTKKANATRAQKAQSAHQEASTARANDAAYIKAAYLQGNGEVILEDLKRKLNGWIKLNNKVAQDGVGARPTGYLLENGQQEVENIYLTPEQRASYLDQSKGQQAILDYIERQLQVGTPGKKETEVETPEEAEERKSEEAAEPAPTTEE